MKKCERSQALDTGVTGEKSEIKRSIRMRDTRVSGEAKKWSRHGIKEVEK
jgi:hypothetical protein